MHCPSCGQQQISAEIKFCSRCGFPLGLVSEILSHGGFLPQLAELNKKKTVLTRKNGVMFSVFWAMFFIFIFTPFFAIVDVEELAALGGVVGIFGGLMFLIASLVWLKKTEKYPELSQNQMQNQHYPNVQPTQFYQPNVNALPPQQSQPVSTYAPPPSAGSWKAPETGELVTHSVTDGTTKLLHKEK